MKNLKLSILGLLAAFFMLTSCTSVESGHQGVLVHYGGRINMEKSLEEGLHWGVHYLWDNVVEYEVREQTMNISQKLNDKDNISTIVNIVVYYNPVKEDVNKLHRDFGKTYTDTKLKPILEASLAKVVPVYSAIELNKTKRSEAEKLLNDIMIAESNSMHVNIKRVQLGSVGISEKVSKIAEETAIQESRNLLAAKKEEEQIQLAKATVAKAQGEYEAAMYEAKTKDILSQPKMLDLLRLENERIMWEGYSETGVSPFGENNYFGGGNGSNPLMLLKSR